MIYESLEWRHSTNIKNYRTILNFQAFAWSVLVVNPGSLKILQSCLAPHELTAENIASVDLLEDRKRPLTPLHAIYFLMPVS